MDDLRDRMIAAGSDAVSPFWGIVTGPEASLELVPRMVEAIYEAMEAERHRPPSQVSPRP